MNEGNALSILGKGTDGRWRIVHQIRNDPHDEVIGQQDDLGWSGLATAQLWANGAPNRNVVRWHRASGSPDLR